MAVPRRPQRVGALIRAELGRIVLEELADPSLQQVSVTDVQVTADLKTARVFFSAGEAVSAKEVKAGFEHAASFIRRQLGQALQLRYVPQLEFQMDTHPESVSRLMSLFNDLDEDFQTRN